MFSKIKRWFASKRGKNTVITILGLALVISILGQVVGWSNIGRLISGTVGTPEGEYSCMPTCDETDIKFLSMPGEDMASFGGAAVIVWINVPEWKASFELGIFDGDSGKDDEGNVIGMKDGNWDETDVEATYTLYADSAKDGTGDIVVGQWYGNSTNPTNDPKGVWHASSDSMPNNAWYDITVNNVPEAQRLPNGNYYYRLEVTRPVEGWGINAFKLRSTGELSTGRSDLVDTAFAIVGMIANVNDVPIAFPEFDGDVDNPGPSVYTGDWVFYFDVPAGTKTISFWDGDFDRGTSADAAADTDDPNTVGKPDWASPSAVDERAGGKGSPNDDYSWPIWGREPPVWYEVLGPNGDPVFKNEEPSGTEEWEQFVVTSDPEMDDSEIDLRVDSIPPGNYTLHIVGLDAHNTVWFRINYDLKDQPPDECPECPICPEPNPTQECLVYPTDTPEPTSTPTPTPIPTECPDPKPVDVLYVLDVSLSMDMPYYGVGSEMKIDAAKQAILDLNDLIETKGGSDSRVGLIAYSAYFKGAADNSSYFAIEPFTTDIDAFNQKVNALEVVGSTPTAAALQKVTDWLPTQWDPNHLPVIILLTDGVPTVDLDEYYFDSYDVQAVSLFNPDGSFRSIEDVRADGKYYGGHNKHAGVTLADTMDQTQALKSALPDVTVHSIAIQAVYGEIFNDGILKYIAAQTGGGFYTAEDTDTLKESLKLAYFSSACGEKEPPGGDGGGGEDEVPCASPRRNQYNVEMTEYFFHGIRYQYQSGTEIKNGAWDEYKFTLTQEEVEAMTAVKFRAQSGRAVGFATLSGCDFTSSEACQSVQDPNEFFTFSFQGASDNGDGTLTLTFRAHCHRFTRLDLIKIGVPDGVTPSSPTNTYESVVCPE